VVVLAVAAAIGIFFKRRAERQQELAAREQRQAPLIELAPTPISSAAPLEGTAGSVDADGYPTQYVDPLALRSLLTQKKYAELTENFEKFQDAAEKDDRHEYWPIDAGDAFASAEPAMNDSLDAWVAASPSSFAPYFARGSHELAVAYAKRGTAYVGLTPKSDLAAMSAELVPAIHDLDHALELRPKLVAALRYEIKATALVGPHSDLRALVDQGTKICPACFQIRVAYLLNSTPRWGGSFLEMQTYTKNVDVSLNPKLRLLAGYEDVATAQIAREEKDFSAELGAAQRACAHGEHWEFLYTRAKAYISQDNLDLAKTDLDHAIAIRPMRADLLAERAYVLFTQKAYEPAARDLLLALRIEPTNYRGRNLFASVVQGVIYQAWQDHLAAHDQDAIREFDLAAELDPNNHDLQQRRAYVLSGGSDAAVVDPAALASASSSPPEDFESVRSLDYALSRQGRFREIVPLWDAYIAKHPDDGRAYLERGGTHVHLGERQQAGDDAKKACDLGVNEGCLRARQLGR
jgi:tetratricopeptide (TPR) repeat protein